MGIIISVDSGSKEFGWCAVERERARARFLMSGTTEATPFAWMKTFRAVCEIRGLAAIDAIYVETPEGYVHDPFRGPHLLVTSRMSGGIEWVMALQYPDISVRLRTAPWWRKALVGKASSPKKGLIDQLVADAVNANVLGMTKSSNVHVRDALGLSIVACWEMARGGGKAA